MEELRIAFLVIGSVFIIGVLVHGIWKMRRQNDVPERQLTPRIEPTTDGQKDNEGFDELGIGEVRVISEAGAHAEPTMESHVDDGAAPSVPSDAPANDLGADEPEPESESQDEHSADTTPVDHGDDSAEHPVEKVEEPPLYASVVTQPKPHMHDASTSVTATNANDEDIPEPPEYLLKETQGLDQGEQLPPSAKQEPDFGLSATPAAPHPKPQADANTSDAPVKKMSKKRAAPRRRKEPTLGEDQMRIEFDEPAVGASTPESTPAASKPAASQTTKQEPEVLVINVRAHDGQSLSGAALLPLLLTLGFKFGEHDIFHRHVNANGKGPVLFSLANMVKPGVFDIDNLETFTTQGISLFMVLPIEGDARQVFNMMHNAARKIAEEFDAQLLDGRRSILTKQGVQQYNEKIREFERQRIISKSSI